MVATTLHAQEKVVLQTETSNLDFARMMATRHGIRGMQLIRKMAPPTENEAKTLALLLSMWHISDIPQEG